MELFLKMEYTIKKKKSHKQTNKKPNKKQGEVLMLKFPPAAVPVQSPALPSLEQRSDASPAQPLPGVLHKSLKSFRYRQHAPNYHFFLFCFVF